MTPRMRLAVGILCLFLAAVQNQRAAAPANPDKDPELSNLLLEARALIDAKKPQPAIEKCEKVIASFKAQYGNSKSKIYCAQTSAENLGYLLMAAAAMDKGEFEADKTPSFFRQPGRPPTSSKLMPCRISVASPKRSRFFSSPSNYHRGTLDIYRNWAAFTCWRRTGPRQRKLLRKLRIRLQPLRMSPRPKY